MRRLFEYIDLHFLCFLLPVAAVMAILMTEQRLLAEEPVRFTWKEAFFPSAVIAAVASAFFLVLLSLAMWPFHRGFSWLVRYLIVNWALGAAVFFPFLCTSAVVVRLFAA
jgi:hypothetical protein